MWRTLWRRTCERRRGGAGRFALQRALAAPDWPAREEALLAAYAVIWERRNALGITEPLATAPTFFHDRPFRVLYAGRFAEACAQRIEDDEVCAIATIAGRIGAVDQLTDNTDLLTRPEVFLRLRTLYEESVG